MRPGDPPAAGSGPEAIPADAETYAAISAANEARERAQRVQKLGLPALPALGPGEVPRQAGGPWAATDGLGVDEPFTDTNPRDPSGVQKHRGID